MSDLKTRAIALYDDYTHHGRDRRAFLAELTLLAGSAVAAQALLSAIAADPAAAAMIAANDKRLVTRQLKFAGAAGRHVSGYLTRPSQRGVRRGVVLVIHENRGLNEHIRDVARRVALSGFIAFAPDLLSSVGGTPADPDAARTEIGTLDLGAVTADVVALIAALKVLPGANGKVGAVGFCWGGAMVNRLAVASGSALAAAVPYYGPAPDPREAPKVKAAMLIQLAELDARVNATALPWVAALQAAHVATQSYVYPGVNHAFNNDTSAERYNAAAAQLAWQRTIALFKAKLGSSR